MNIDEKVCPFCAETIKKAAIKCRHCNSDISSQTVTEEVNLEVPNNEILVPAAQNSEILQTNKQNTLEIKPDFTLLQISGTIFCGGIAICYLLLKYSFINYLIVGNLFNVIFIIFLLTVYLKSRKQLDINVRDQIPWYSNTFFVFLTPYIAVPLYFNYLKKNNSFSGNVSSISWGWVLGIVFGVLTAIQIYIHIDKEMSDIFSDSSSAVIANQSHKNSNEYNKNYENSNFNNFIGKGAIEFLDAKINQKILLEIIESSQLERIKTYFHVGTEIIKEGKFIVGQGCKARECPDFNGIFVLNTINNKLVLITYIEEKNGVEIFKRNDDDSLQIVNGNKLVVNDLPNSAKLWLKERNVTFSLHR